MEQEDFDSARSNIEAGRIIVLSCAQKVCLSGDYGDMHAPGAVLTASIRSRPALHMTRSTAAQSQITLNGTPFDGFDGWHLVSRFMGQVTMLPRAYRFDVVPTELRNVGLGSSGAASVLFAAALAIAYGLSPTTEDLIRSAHRFETDISGYTCGPQDHAAAVLGGLNVVEFPSLAARRVTQLGVWRSLSFWTTDERREASEFIPAVVARHTDSIWATKIGITRQFAGAFAACETEAVVDLMRQECAVQTKLGMLTKRQQAAVTAAKGAGGAGKVSGAGGGGILVLAGADKNSYEAVRAAMSEQGLRELELSVDDHGLDVQFD